MPYGRSWTYMFTFSFCSLFSTFAGSQIVHEYYQPLKDMEQLVQEELKRLIAVHERRTDDPWI